MPKASSSSSSPDVKPDPYPKESPKKGVKSVSWTEDMDREVISHILSSSDIKLVFNWAQLQQKSFPELTTKQLKSRWDNKLKAQLFPGDILKKAKQATDGDEGQGDD